MRSLVAFLIILISYTFPTLSFAIMNTGTISVKGQLPQGIMVSKHKITVKKEFIIEKLSSTRAIAKIRANNKIATEFNCQCQKGEKSCTIVTTPQTAYCTSTGCEHCYMLITAPH